MTMEHFEVDGFAGLIFQCSNRNYTDQWQWNTFKSRDLQKACFENNSNYNHTEGCAPCNNVQNSDNCTKDKSTSTKVFH